MKRIDLLNELRGLPRAELQQRAKSIAEELMKLRFRMATGQLEQTHRVRQLRRDFARIQTFLRPEAGSQRKPISQGTRQVGTSSSAK